MFLVGEREKDMAPSLVLVYSHEVSFVAERRDPEELARGAELEGPDVHGALGDMGLRVGIEKSFRLGPPTQLF